MIILKWKLLPVRFSIDWLMGMMHCLYIFFKLSNVVAWILGIAWLYKGIGCQLASSAPISIIYTFRYESMKASFLPHLAKVKASSALLLIMCFILEIDLLFLQVEKHVYTWSVDLYSLRDNLYHEIP